MNNPAEPAPPLRSGALPAGDERTGWLMKHEAWLRLLARNEIDSRFAGKFDPSDAVQQTLLAAWQGWDTFRGNAEVQRLAWLRQILAHQLAHLARHYAGTQKRDVAREQLIDQTLCQSAQRLDALLPTSDPSPSGMAAASEQRLRLAKALEQLPEDYRHVILLRNLEDLPHEEVARRMNRTVGAVRMLWVRALAALRDAMHEGTRPSARSESEP
jgi:RNA polymerase sigma-70 factor (ECF subfamily)